MKTIARKARIGVGIIILIIFISYNFMSSWEYAQTGYTGIEFFIRLIFQTAMTGYSLSIIWVVTYIILNQQTRLPHIVLFATWVAIILSASHASRTPHDELSALQNLIGLMFFFGIPFLAFVDRPLSEIE